MSNRRRVAALVAVGAVSAIGCGGEDGSSSGALPLVVDTDMGFDDVRALMVLATSPEIDLLAVTVSGNGLARCPAAALNAAALLRELDRADVPVACGSRVPLDGFNLAPTAWRDDADALAGMELDVEALDPAVADADGVALLVESIQGAPDGVTVLTLGPLTNLALALEVAPDLGDRIDRVVTMGGAVRVGGNTLGFETPPEAEFNIWFDPVAAQRVLDTDLPITLVPLDATNAAPIDPAGYERLGVGADPTTARLLQGFVAEHPFFGGLYHWDDLAAAALVDPEVITTADLSIVVRTDGVEIGRTAEDPTGRPVRVAIGADRERFAAVAAPALGDVGDRPYEAEATVRYSGSDCTYDGPDPLPPTLDIEVINTSSTSALGVVAGVFDPDTTQADVDAFLANPSGPPPYLTLTGIAPLPADTSSYWRFTSPSDASLQCVLSMTNAIHLVGFEPP